MAKKKKVMTEFSLEEVSFVRKPAQKPALADIMKDEDMGDLTEMSDEDLLKGDDLEDFSFEALQKMVAQLATSVEGGHQHGICVTRNHDGTPHIYINYAGGERDDQHSHDVVMVEGQMTLTENFGHSHDIDEDDLRQAILTTLMKSDMVFPEEADIADLLKVWDQSGDDTLEKDAEMLDQDPKAAEKLAAVEADLAKAKEDLVKAEADKADAEALAKMTDAEKAFMDKMSDDDAKKKFKGMSKMERMKMMRKADDEDPEVYKSASGEVFRKSDDPRLVEMAKREDAREKEMAELRKSREEDQFRKTAETDYAHIPGDVEVRMALAKAIEKSDEDDEMKEKMRQSMKGKNDAAKRDMKTNGKPGYAKGDGVGEGSSIMKRDEAANELDRLADEVQKADPSISSEDAYEKACNDNPEVYKAAIMGEL